MKKYFLKWKDKTFPVRTITHPEDVDYRTPIEVNVADIELWWAIEEDCEKGNKEAKEIDNSIFYYCDSGFIASDPTDEEIIKRIEL